MPCGGGPGEVTGGGGGGLGAGGFTVGFGAGGFTVGLGAGGSVAFGIGGVVVTGAFGAVWLVDGVAGFGADGFWVAGFWAGMVPLLPLAAVGALPEVGLLALEAPELVAGGVAGGSQASCAQIVDPSRSASGWLTARMTIGSSNLGAVSPLE